MILDEIVARRRKQLAREIAAVPPDEIQRRAAKAPAPRNFAGVLERSGLSVIAEVKKASPSKGVICEDFHPAQIAQTYEKAGADALSVLTEEHYFQGSAAYLQEIRKAVSLPILRKDFIIDPYQIYEARAIGADAVLLIAAILDDETLTGFLKLAGNLGLACLTEVHDENELARAIRLDCPIIGINNRNLKTFEVSLDTTGRLAGQVPAGRTVVSESGIKTNADMRTVREQGADAVLIGETLMRSGNVAAALDELRRGV